MLAVYLPGNRDADRRYVPDAVPAKGQVSLALKASTICGSDLRTIYCEYLGEGSEAYQSLVAGHAAAGSGIALGPGVTVLGLRDRVVVYHISGRGRCRDCRQRYQISCNFFRTSRIRSAARWRSFRPACDRPP